MKLSIEAELVYNFGTDTQVIANLEASRTSDQLILSESLDIQPPAKILSDTTPHGDRRIELAKVCHAHSLTLRPASSTSS